MNIKNRNIIHKYCDIVSSINKQLQEGRLTLDFIWA